MQIVLFTLVAILLYLAADWLLRSLERRRGAQFEHRSMIYFVIIMVMTLGTFELLQRYLQQTSGG